MKSTNVSHRDHRRSDCPGVAIAPAWNLTRNEIRDAVDASAVTLFEPELLVDSWGNTVTTIALGVYAFFTRNQPAKDPDVPKA